ncbi:PorT family protein [Hymenobacter gummosus]|uniref:PorT family protein n=1 Tax=Hymenobacter gummosus TaxID=1776032 RepID=A0A3S0H454_9BACT|nr:porin family protein [Hymenobacter gummosus]RTQ47172.1 PorT family protein [Hymenobacter gummosus]
MRSAAPTDTIRGYVDTYRGTHRWGFVRFRATPDGATEVLHTRELQAVGTADGRQVLRTRPVSGDSLRLLEVVADGPLNLYYGYSPRADVDFFLQQNGGEVLPLRRTQFLPVLQSVMAGCPTLAVNGGKQRLQYARQPLAQLVDAYNRCSTVAGKAHRYPGARPPRPEIGVRAGLQRSQLWYEDNGHAFGYQKPDANTNFTGAVQLTLPIGGSFRAVVEGAYSQAHSYVQVHDLPRASVNYFTRSADLKASYLQVPLMLRWQVGREGRLVRPFVEAGGGLNVVLNYRAWYTETPDVSYDKADAYDLGMDRVQFMVRGGGGVDVRTPIGKLGVALHTQRVSIGSPREKTAFRLLQSDLSLSYMW